MTSSWRGRGRAPGGRARRLDPQAAVAEFAARRREPDPGKATPLGFTPFAPNKLAPELAVTTNSAELLMAQSRDAARRARELRPAARREDHRVPDEDHHRVNSEPVRSGRGRGRPADRRRPRPA